MLHNLHTVRSVRLSNPLLLFCFAMATNTVGMKLETRLAPHKCHCINITVYKMLLVYTYVGQKFCTYLFAPCKFYAKHRKKRMWAGVALPLEAAHPAICSPRIGNTPADQISPNHAMHAHGWVNDDSTNLPRLFLRRSNYRMVLEKCLA